MKFLFYILAGYLLYMILKGRFGAKGRGPGKAGKTGSPEPPVRDEEEMIQDPVCKSYVPMSDALKVRSRSGVVYFCGPQCKEKYFAGRDV
ncbi:MAG: hypothetical protein ACE5EZ_03525 [Thermodesulfobacteriota bacterium]